MRRKKHSTLSLAPFNCFPEWQPCMNWPAPGKIPSIKTDRRRLFDSKEIDTLMESLKCHYHKHEKTANKIVGDIRDRDL
ncbi:MAG: hypothetical protein MRK01_07740 [Candidatus Scalindua sp.]|nr:hypothetical protein [Candidatus Scalindua sp.]